MGFSGRRSPDRGKEVFVWILIVFKVSKSSFLAAGHTPPGYHSPSPGKARYSRLNSSCETLKMEGVSASYFIFVFGIY
jgi:hypothetical protein